jgi:hypothetical protein
MSPFVRKVILVASSVAFLAAAVRGIAALPEAMHGAGVIVPHAWEQGIVVAWSAGVFFRRDGQVEQAVAPPPRH